MENTLETHQSVYRERLLEHLLIGELLKHSWFYHQATLEVSQPSIDRSGHDVVLEANGITRHVQLKASSHTAKTSKQNIHIGLGSKPSGCVIWVRFDPATLAIGPFLFFGNEPGKPLPPIEHLKISRHTRANSEGIKAERPNIRTIPIAMFRKIDTIEELHDALFGK
ncbi:MAG: hypothetical protein HYS18_11435 [Burkholderiales bacterium]|nr:hypothetical protein [Burkholderiales bacterium]